MIQATAPHLVEVDEEPYDTSNWLSLKVDEYRHQTSEQRATGERGTLLGYGVFVLADGGKYFRISETFETRDEAMDERRDIADEWARAKWMAHPKHPAEYPYEPS